MNFGSLNLDEGYQIPQYLAPGETMAALSQQVHPGGKGLNQSIAMARVGASVCHIGVIGQGGEMLVVQNEVSCLPQMIELAAQRGMQVALNPSPFEDSLLSLPFDKITWPFMNEVEGAQMTGQTEPDEILCVLRTRYPQLQVVLTLGHNGSICAAQSRTIHQPIFKAKAVDTTAAGDTFTGYFLVALTKNRPLEECMRRAAAASAISVSRAGASVSIPTPTEVDAPLNT